MEFFHKAKVVRLKSHLEKYLVADDNEETIRQSRNGSSHKARWTVELVDGDTHLLRLKSCHGRYLTASDEPFLLNTTGKKVVQTSQTSKTIDVSTLWEPIKEGYEVKFRTKSGGKFLRANGGTPPWRNSVTYDLPHRTATQDWVLWGVDVVDILEFGSVSSFSSGFSSFSSDDFKGFDIGSSSPIVVSSSRSAHRGSNISSPSSMVASSRSAHRGSDISSPSPMVASSRSAHRGSNTGSPSPMVISSRSTHRGSNTGSPSPMVISSRSAHDFTKESGMELFQKAKSVRLRSHHDKYLLADDDEESVCQDRNGTCRNAKWTVEFVQGMNVLRLKSCFGKYLTATGTPYLLGMTGKKVLQTMPNRVDSSVEWEPIREGFQVRLKTRYGNYLRANGGLPPWRNSITHDIPHRTATQDWVLWDVDIVEIKPSSLSSLSSLPASQVPPPISVSSESEPTSSPSSSPRLSKLESSDSFVCSPPKNDGRVVYYCVVDEKGEVDEGIERPSFNFKGNGVEELKEKIKEETGLEEIIVCSRNSLNGKLYPLKLHLPPNNTTMHVVVVPSHSKGAVDMVAPGSPH